MLREYDTVRLRHSLTAGGVEHWPGVESTALPAGALGTIVMVYDNNPNDTAYEVEFVAEDGSTLGLVTLKESDIELVK